MSKEAYLKKLGKRIETLRKKAGMTQTAFALKCDKDKQNINRLEKGRMNPTVFFMIEIASGLEMTLSEVLDF